MQITSGNPETGGLGNHLDASSQSPSPPTQVFVQAGSGRLTPANAGVPNPAIRTKANVPARSLFIFNKNE